MKALKYWGWGPRKSKSGFTLIELLIVMVILAILAGVVVMAVGGVFGTAKSAAYNAVKDDMQNAVVAYATDHQGNFPYNASTAHIPTNGNCSTCHYVNMSAIMTNRGGTLREVPDGTVLIAGGTAVAPNDNCDYESSNAVCDSAAHYIWGADDYGNVYSYCSAGATAVGTCTTNNSGYQGVWP
jgi:prepilin-type N-terminal cleavage/methylation domain-containing protein